LEREEGGKLEVPEITANAPLGLDEVGDDVSDSPALGNNVVDTIGRLELLTVETGHGVSGDEAIQSIRALPRSSSCVRRDFAIH
jgi:hypothetical protein